MTLKIKDKKKFGRNCILDNFITRKSELLGPFVDKGSGSGIFSDRDPDPGDPKRPDPDPQHWFYVICSLRCTPSLHRLRSKYARFRDYFNCFNYILFSLVHRNLDTMPYLRNNFGHMIKLSPYIYTNCTRI